jgi:hypothetical protein
MRLRHALGAAIFLLQAFSIAAQADPIPQDTLAAEQQSCVAACTQKGIPLANCMTYCSCFAKGLGEKITQEEYKAVSDAAKAYQAPPKDVLNRMAEITSACRASLK